MMIHQQLPNPLLLPHIKGTSQQILRRFPAALIHPILLELICDYPSASSFF